MSDDLTAIDRDIEAMVGAHLSPAAKSRAIAEMARTEIAKAAATNEAALGRTVGSTTYVDGTRSNDLERVRPDGEIVAVWQLAAGIVRDVLTMLQEASPVLTGAYAGAHLVFADDREVNPNETLPEARRYVIVNAMPYARKIERGSSPQAPEGVYEATAALAAARFGNAVRIRFIYRAVDGVAEAAPRARSPAPSRNRPGPQRAAWLARQPAIEIAV